MEKIRNMPVVLQRKMLLTLLIGAACLVVGGAVYLFSKDRNMLTLSILVSVLSTMKGITLYRLITQKKYESVEGICVSISGGMIRKYRKIKIIDDNGTESSLLLSKHAKIKIGYRYRFYFKDNRRLTIGNEYFDSKLTSDCFLGFEELGESESRTPGQEDTVQVKETQSGSAPE